MIFQELNRGKCKTYLVGCEETRKAILIDPDLLHTDRYIAMLGYRGLTLDATVDTHTHADHSMAAFPLHDLTGSRIIMSTYASAPAITDYVHDGDTVEVGKLRFKVLHTPGHTPDSISLYGEGRVFTGDVLLIRGTGRADFQGGDAGAQYDAITRKLFVLPDATLVYPAHDYRGNTVSTIGEEKKHNPRIAGKTREEYIALMNSIQFPLPDKIQEVLMPNQTAIEDDRTKFPELAELSKVQQLSAADVRKLMRNPEIVLLDVREMHEYIGDLGHIGGSLLIPLRELTMRASELDPYRNKHIVCICRAGVRSTTAAAILTGLGFEHVSNLHEGMLSWRDHGFPVVG
jgi:glyoxylase-like metal-dependent hydrolase (beta-lactamase superfamily II)